MSFLFLPRTYGNLMRLREIITILGKHGFGHLVSRLRLSEYIPGFGKLKVAMETKAGFSGDVPTPERIAHVLEDLGATFIKFGQLLATRPDLIPPAYSSAFSRLQDKVEPFPASEAIKLIETAFSEKIGNIFTDFDKTSIASGSIGQVHTATLKNGREVVVKVKRPGTDRRVRDDLDLLIWFADQFEKHVPELSHLRPHALCEEFSHSIRHELDFVSEASYTAKFGETFKKIHEVKIPEVLWDYVSHDVLVLERIKGTPLKDVDFGQIAPGKREEIAQNLGNTFMRQFFLTGVFHADPHPGNVFLMSDNSIALVDFGQCGHLSGELRHRLGLCLAALSQGEFDVIADIYSDIGGISEETDMEAFKPAMISMIDRYYGVPVDKMDLARVFEELVTISREHNIYLPRDLVLLGKSMVTVVGVSQTLDPGFRLDTVAKPMTRKLMRNYLDPKKLLKGSAFSAYRLINLLRHMPGDIENLMRKAKTGKLRVIFHHEALETLTQRLDRAANRLSLSLVIASIIIGSSMVLSQTSPGKHPFPLVGEINISHLIATLGLGAAIVLGIALIWGIIRSD